MFQVCIPRHYYFKFVSRNTTVSSLHLGTHSLCQVCNLTYTLCFSFQLKTKKPNTPVLHRKPKYWVLYKVNQAFLTKTSLNKYYSAVSSSSESSKSSEMTGVINSNPNNDSSERLILPKPKIPPEAFATCFAKLSKPL